MIIVELESGVWIADGDGDPARTINENNAKIFRTTREACVALTEARKYKPFKNAQIISKANP